MKAVDNARAVGSIPPNKYFCLYQLPRLARRLLIGFWRLEKEAEALLKGLAE